MAKEVTALVKLQIESGKATPAPPVGPALSPTGINIGEFCTKFNEQSKVWAGYQVPVVITVYKDRTFSIKIKTPPVSDFIRKELNIAKGSSNPNTQNVGTLTKEQMKRIAEKKLDDLNTDDMDMAMKIIAGTARQMGVDVEK